MMRIAVYCSSRNHLAPQYENAATALGQWIGSHGYTMVYGGVKSGLMHTVAQAAHESGGKLLGVVPARFVERTDPLVDRVINCHDLGDRKTIMMDNADLFVVLPGGLGTIDEWISTLSQLIVNDGDRRSIVVVNIDGIYDHQLAQLEATAHSVFARGKHIDMSIAVDNIEEMNVQLEKVSNDYEK